MVGVRVFCLLLMPTRHESKAFIRVCLCSYVNDGTKTAENTINELTTGMATHLIFGQNVIGQSHGGTKCINSQLKAIERPA